MCHPHQAVSLTRAGTFSAFCVPGSGNTKMNNNGGARIGGTPPGHCKTSTQIIVTY